MDADKTKILPRAETRSTQRKTDFFTTKGTKVMKKGKDFFIHR
jgi:hypothetical protein